MIVFSFIQSCFALSSTYFELSRAAIGTASNELYYAEMGFGTPYQQFYIVIDTGSSILWVANQSCDCYKREFNPDKSKTYFNEEIAFQENYDSGSVSGIWSTDEVEITGSLVNANMEFLLATKSTLGFPELISGLMGLSSWTKYQNIFQIAYADSKIESPLFGFQFRHNAQSYMYYGDFNSTVLSQTTWVDVISEYRWSLELLGMTINGESLHVSIRQALLDSGTSCLLLQPDLIDTITSQINGCTGPEFIFYFRGVQVSVPSELYMIVDESGCQPCVYASPNDYVILGDPFMQAITVIFDKQKQQIGFYQADILSQLNMFACPIVILVLQSMMLMASIGLLISYMRYKDTY